MSIFQISLNINIVAAVLPFHLDFLKFYFRDKKNFQKKSQIILLFHQTPLLSLILEIWYSIW